jgi:glycerol-3-phosphate acyltransferase PlsX
MIIAVDAAGGDHAPREVVKGAMKARQEYGVEIALVGRKDLLHVMAGQNIRKSGLSITDARQVITSNEHPMKALRSKPDSSIVVGINMVQKGEAAAFVSAGNTGAVFGAALLRLGRLPGIERPAIGTILDFTATTPVLLIDAGANIDSRPNHLVQFAQMGSLYAENVLGIKSPRIGLLSNGTEAEKGSRLVTDSNKLLASSGLNFVGNIEGHDIVKRTADVVVTDGFIGNIVLKTIEGMGETFRSGLGHVGDVLSSTYHIQGRLLLNLVGLHSWSSKLDYQEYGGASLLGVNGNVVIAHGRSQAQAIKNAIGLAKQAVERGILPLMQEYTEQFSKYKSDEEKTRVSNSRARRKKEVRQ